MRVVPVPPTAAAAAAQVLPVAAAAAPQAADHPSAAAVAAAAAAVRTAVVHRHPAGPHPGLPAAGPALHVPAAVAVAAEEDKTVYLRLYYFKRFIPTHELYHFTNDFIQRHEKKYIHNQSVSLYDHRTSRPE
jgi:hypothetical protein